MSILIRNYSFKIILLVLISLLIMQTPAYAVTSSVSTSVTITAQVVSGSSGGGGGGGGGGVSTTIPTTVNFSGMAYPSSTVVILQDGIQVVSTIADPNANFSASLSGLTQGNYTFSVYTIDKNGNHSTGFTFPVYVTSGATITIGGIIIAPTINVDKTEVKRGDNEAIFGFATPDSTVNISVHSDTEHFVSTTTGTTGAYLYNFDTTPLEYGEHNASSRALLPNNKVSAQTNPVSFIVSTENKVKPATCGTLIGDLNCDGKVNLIDFSIMAYWYKKGTLPPSNVDLNGDGKITLVDFSIMAYYWTG
jgi:hypothetical protein